MIKTITKQIFMCDMCGYEYEGSIGDIVPKDVFEFTVNLADGAKNVQICPACQQKLRNALNDKLFGHDHVMHCICDERRKDND